MPAKIKNQVRAIAVNTIVGAKFYESLVLHSDHRKDEK
ncbi:hypothetical protein AQPE_1188 [Aquipluma nitroreducens]|uniref:Uncharacterized protein n=1 Tax=Aquipluma nitroreducens TaxID=2010828 RepID=A0A5K7S6C1_9BACT|nr:hypothetical protein AQPE_1188 [Aquipluma nitroreducens]